MSGASTTTLPTLPARAGVAPRSVKGATTEPTWVKWTLIGVALGFLTLFLFIPLAIVFVEAFKKAGHETPKVEGFPACDWVLIDTGDLIIHIFRPEVRQFYNLEKMWGADRPRERLVG